jgi:hypothetical protein
VARLRNVCASRNSLEFLIQVWLQLEVAVHFAWGAFHCAILVDTSSADDKKKSTCVITDYAYSLCLRMKTKTQKIARNFRLDPVLNANLKNHAEATGIPETRIIEDSLREYLGGGGMVSDIKRRISRLKFSPSCGCGEGWSSPFLLPVG